jgi:hypothetical protein
VAYEQAEETHRQAFRLMETVLGKEHPSTLASMNNLAMVLGDQGKYEQAEEILRQTIRLMETVLGKEHPDTLTSINNLATVLMGQGKYEQVEEMHQQALAAVRRCWAKSIFNTDEHEQPGLSVLESRMLRRSRATKVQNLMGMATCGTSPPRSTTSCPVTQMHTCTHAHMRTCTVA